MALVYLTRSKAGKSKLVECNGIQLLMPMVVDPANTSESKAQTLQLLLNAVYDNKHKTLMFENGIFEIVMQYMRDPKSLAKGFKCCYFLMSHLAHEYPALVNSSGIVQEAMTRIQQFETPLNTQQAHTLEAMNRLLWSLTLDDATRRLLFSQELVDGLVRSLSLETNKEIEHDPSGSPLDAHKMRAAAALGQLTNDPDLPDATEAISKLLHLWETTNSADPGILVWLSVQPCINQMILSKEKLLEQLEHKLHSHHLSFDLGILLIGTRQTEVELDQLMADNIGQSGQTLGDFMLGIFEKEGHSM